MNDLTLKEAKAIIKATLGDRWTIDGCSGRWFATVDKDDNSSGVLYSSLARLIAELQMGTGLFVFPEGFRIEEAMDER